MPVFFFVLRGRSHLRDSVPESKTFSHIFEPFYGEKMGKAYWSCNDRYSRRPHIAEKTEPTLCFFLHRATGASLERPRIYPDDLVVSGFCRAAAVAI